MSSLLYSPAFPLFLPDALRARPRKLALTGQDATLTGGLTAPARESLRSLR